MIRLTSLVLTLFLCGCADITANRPVKKLSAHEQLTSQLKDRSPDVDAATFYHAGGTGYIQTIGGVKSPIGLDEFNPEYGRDFETLKEFAPHLFSQISFLYMDPSGHLTWGDMMGYLPPDRLQYYETRARYAARFNVTMAKLQKKKPNKAQMATPRKLSD